MMSPDPFGGHLTNPQSLNRYAYVQNNPLIYVDPSGQSCVYYNNDGSSFVDGQASSQCDADWASQNDWMYTWSGSGRTLDGTAHYDKASNTLTVGIVEDPWQGNKLAQDLLQGQGAKIFSAAADTVTDVVGTYALVSGAGIAAPLASMPG